MRIVAEIKLLRADASGVVLSVSYAGANVTHIVRART